MRPSSSIRAGTLAAALTVLLLAAPPAWAHVALQSSTPARGSSVEAPVRDIRLRFSQPVEPRYTTATIRGPTGETKAEPAEVVHGSNGRELSLAVGELGGGEYVVNWRAVAKDGHVVSGRFSFTARPPSTASPPELGNPAEGASPEPDRSAAAATTERLEELHPPDEPFSLSTPLPIAIRWVHFVALLGMIGSAAFRFVVLPVARRRGAVASGHQPVEARAWRVAAFATGLLGVAIVGRLWMQSALMHGVELAWDGAALRHLLLGTAWGKVWLLEVVAGTAYGAGLALTRAKHSSGRAVALVIAALTLALVPPLSGHAATVERLRVLAIVADALHVLGAGAWLGTLLVLLLASSVRSSTSPESEPSPLALVIAFSPLALASSAVTAASGLANALFHFASVSQLWTTGYGITLLVKLGAVAAVAAVGLYNWRWVLPALATGAPPRKLLPSARLELLAAAAVVLVTAILVALPTPRSP